MRRDVCVALSFAGMLAVAGCSSGGNPTGSAPQISVTVSGPSSTRLLTTAQFSAAVTNSSNQGVTWQVNGVNGGNSTTGTISATGLYTAPLTLPSPNTVTISATSQASASATGYFAESLLNPSPVVSSVVVTEVGTTTSFLVDILGSGFVASS